MNNSIADKISESIEKRADWLNDLSDQIWDHPELSYDEYFASALITEALEKEGFAVEKNAGGIKTAVIGRYGEGKPCIGILGEYDALSGMSQVADLLEKKPIVKGGNGHGCGHNLLGIGSLAATIAVKDYMVETGLKGSIIYYGCPAEEGGAGKGFMAREHCFDEADAMLSWHPGDLSAAPAVSSLANDGVIYSYKGISSHAAAAPWLGRSALDAVTLLNTGIQFLREHIPEKARIHYAVLDTGGKAPNVVQADASGYYIVRHPDIEVVKEIRKRVDDVAKGAALMTGTIVEKQFLKSYANLIPNKTLAKVITQSMEEAVKPVYSEEDMEYARKFKEVCEGTDTMMQVVSMVGADSPVGKLAASHANEPLHTFTVPYYPKALLAKGSTDVGDVSWIKPTGQAQICTMVAESGTHTWQRTAQGKSGIAHKGMLFAGKVLAGSAIKLMECKELLGESQTEFETVMNGKVYEPMSSDTSPEFIKSHLYGSDEM